MSLGSITRLAFDSPGSPLVLYRQVSSDGSQSPEEGGGLMFSPKTTRIASLAAQFPEMSVQLDRIFGAPNVSYVDWGNVRNWSNRLGWHVCPKRLKQLMDSFGDGTRAKMYYGTIPGDPESETFIQEVGRLGYEVHTKDVKSIRLSIDVSSISAESPDIVKHFIFGRLLSTFSVEMTKQLNDHLRELNKKGITYLEDLKCNFDVEIGRDMIVDPIIGKFDVFSLWSADSDFADPVSDLLRAGKKVVVFGTSGLVSRELNLLRKDGLQIFDVKKIREFICWSRELPPQLKVL
jgi:uncharacterized LabA/DUF88 family protein